MDRTPMRLGALLALSLTLQAAPAVRAATVEGVYTGPRFTVAEPPFTLEDRVTAYIRFDAPAEFVAAVRGASEPALVEVGRSRSDPSRVLGDLVVHEFTMSAGGFSLAHREVDTWYFFAIVARGEPVAGSASLFEGYPPYENPGDGFQTFMASETNGASVQYLGSDFAGIFSPEYGFTPQGVFGDSLNLYGPRPDAGWSFRVVPIPPSLPLLALALVGACWTHSRLARGSRARRTTHPESG